MVNVYFCAQHFLADKISTRAIAIIIIIGLLHTEVIFNVPPMGMGKGSLLNLSSLPQRFGQ